MQMWKVLSIFRTIKRTSFHIILFNKKFIHGLRNYTWNLMLLLHIGVNSVSIFQKNHMCSSVERNDYKVFNFL